MKYITLILGFSIALIACRGDQCPAEDFTGTYIGDRTCAGVNSQEGDTVVVSRLDDDRLTIQIFEYSLEATIKGCDLDVDDNVIANSGRRGSASLEGTTLTARYETLALGIIIEECEFIGELVQ